jgi:hypothetical protein
MGETTLTIDTDTKELLTDYRAAEHDSWADTLTGMMKLAPSVEAVKDGCEYCDDSHFYAGSVEETGGVVQFFHTEYEGEDIYGSRYFCSTECAHEAQEEVNAMVPEEPDEVLVGGKSEMRATVKGASFYIDRDTKEVSHHHPQTPATVTTPSAGTLQSNPPDPLTAHPPATATTIRAARVARSAPRVRAVAATASLRATRVRRVRLSIRASSPSRSGSTWLAPRPTWTAATL